MTSEPLRLAPPPALRPREGAGSALLIALPALGGVASVALVGTMGMGAGGAMRSRSLIAAGVFLLATLAFVLVQLDRQRRQRHLQQGASRADYLAHLARVRATLAATAASERAALLRDFPAPDSLPLLTGRRDAAPPGRLLARFGRCSRRLVDPPVAPERAPGDPVDPVSSAALDRLLDAFGPEAGLPATIDLREHTDLTVDGRGARDLARAVLCSAATRHEPSQVRIAVVATADALAEWEWSKWLPHARSPEHRDAVGPVRLIAGDPSDLPGPGTDDAHLLLVADGVPVDARIRRFAGQWRSHTVLSVGADARLDPASGRETRATLASAGAVFDGEPDGCGPELAEATARRLAARHPVPDLVMADLPTLLQADAGSRERLRVPIGLTDAGAPVHLDLRESAEGGDGPHGLVVGATGSGKSELLRTVVTGLAATHPPEELNLVLVDFKGGATFAGLEALPHCSAFITNLSGDLALVERMHDALAGELVRRQEILRRAGDLASLRDLDRARAAGGDVPTLPTLLVVIDEFSELLATRPELSELFAMLGRLGRSLGVHLVLATQRLDPGRWRGLEAHIGFRVALRTFSAEESRAAIRVPDAHELPRTPGVGYLSSGPTELVRFRAVQVSTPTIRHEAGRVRRPLGFTAAPVAQDQTEAVSPGPSVLDSTVAAALARAGDARHAHRIWLPPLDGTVPQRALLPDLVTDPDLGLVSPGWRAAGPRTFPIGVVDRPREQRHEPYVVRLDGSTGHAAIVGGPRTGRSTALATLVSGLALTSTPLESRILLIDLDGGALGELADLPHVAGVADRRTPDRVRRMVTEARSHAERAGSGQGPDLFLAIDGWGALREAFPDLEEDLVALAQRSLGHGVHLLLTATRWSEVRPALRDVIGTRVELRLGDPLESSHPRQLASTVPDAPGRGLTPSGHHCLVAHPGELRDLASLARESWSGSPTAPLVDLPARVHLAELHDHAAATSLLLGCGDDLAPVAMDPADLTRMIAFGDTGSGKTSMLRCLAAEIARTHTADDARLVVLDPKRTLTGALPGEIVLDHVTGQRDMADAVRDLADLLRRRLSGPEVTLAALEDRSWWSGPDIWVLVDDYELIASGAPLSPLGDLLPHAREIGLHVVIARRSGGASRALHAPVLQALRELDATTLLLDGSPEEGPIVGSHRLQPEPPGRGRMVTRRAERVVQLAWLDANGLDAAG